MAGHWGDRWVVWSVLMLAASSVGSTDARRADPKDAHWAVLKAGLMVFQRAEKKVAQRAVQMAAMTAAQMDDSLVAGKAAKKGAKSEP